MSRLRLIEQASAPTTPGTGEVLIYADAYGRVASMDDSGRACILSGLDVNPSATGVALTIASDAVTATLSYHTVDTEGAAATDNLATINGGAAGNILILATADSGRDVTVKHGTGNIYLTGAADFTLSNVRDKLMLIKIGSEWNEIGRGDNA